jgi:hypothetical protein
LGALNKKASTRQGTVRGVCCCTGVGIRKLFWGNEIPRLYWPMAISVLWPYHLTFSPEEEFTERLSINLQMQNMHECRKVNLKSRHHTGFPRKAGSMVNKSFAIFSALFLFSCEVPPEWVVKDVFASTTCLLVFLSSFYY